MKLEINNYYKILFEVAGKFLTFDTKILENDGETISFKDLFGDIYQYKISDIKSTKIIEPFKTKIKEDRNGKN